MQCNHDFILCLKVKKDGLPIYKTHLNFIQSSTRMLMQKTFGILKGKFRFYQEE
jgi:hypothetical protein